MGLGVFRLQIAAMSEWSQHRLLWHQRARTSHQPGAAVLPSRPCGVPPLADGCREPSPAVRVSALPGFHPARLRAPLAGNVSGLPCRSVINADHYSHEPGS
ncbi:hypothetical protein D3C76_193940 [compost metagenome]